MKALRAVGNLFIVIGATIMLFALYELVGTSQITKRHQNALAAEFEALLASDEPTLGGPLPEETPKEKTPPRAGPPPIARLRIPKIEVNHIVVEGATLDALAYGPGHYRDTPPIGGKGSAAIAGHRTGWGSPFYSLDRLGAGDRIEVETADATYVYEVTRQIVVEPDDVWVLDGDPKSDDKRKLTLTTCTPRFTSRLRLIVWADLVEADAREGIGRWQKPGDSQQADAGVGRWQQNPGEEPARVGRWAPAEA